MNNLDLANIKYSTFTTKGNKNHKTFKILWLTALVITSTLFVAGSIWDYKIAKGLGDLNDNGFISWISLFYDRFAYTMTIPFFLGIVGIFLETLYKKYGKESVLYANLMIVMYVLFVTAFVVIYTLNGIDIANEDKGYGKGRNYWFGLERIQILIVVAIQITWSALILVGILVYLRLFFSKRDDILIRNYWIDGIKILVFFIFMDLLVNYTMKVLWGRPYMVHVDFSYVTKHLPESWKWTGDKGDIVDAQYYDWWQIQGFKQAYWDARNSIGINPYGNTHWDDVAFPSGHMNAASMLVYTTAVMLMNEKRKDKIQPWKWCLLGLAVFNTAMMAMFQIISRTHWMTDLMFTLLFVVLVFKPFTWVVNHVIYFILSLIWRKTKTAQSMVEVEVKNKKVICINIGGTYWAVAKIRSSKVETSKKYKRWHSDNFKY